MYARTDDDILPARHRRGFGRVRAGGSRRRAATRPGPAVATARPGHAPAVPPPHPPLSALPQERATSAPPIPPAPRVRHELLSAPPPARARPAPPFQPEPAAPPPARATPAPPVSHQAEPASPPAERRRPGRRSRTVVAEVLLTLGALLGVAVTGVTVLAAQSGLRPLVVRSGSMEPTIPTGSMVLMQRIGVDDVRVGDVVAVERPDHTRVTHRVIGIEVKGATAELVLKGDANEDPDPVPVAVTKADRLVGQVPEIGRVAAWLATARGGFLVGCLFTAVAMHVLRRHGAGRRAAPARA